MKRVGLAGFAFAALISSSALAADLPAKAPVYKAPPPVVFSWTGFYVGANIGYSWGRSSNDWTVFAAATGGASPTTCAPAGPAFCAAGSDTSRLNGVIGGFQAGYNWQTANYVVGIEADIQASGQRRDQVFTMTNATQGTAFGIPVTGTVTADYSEKLTWLGTVRGRAGFAGDRWLIYATGGLAYGRVTIDGSMTAVSSNQGPGCVTLNPVAFTCPLANFSNGVTKAGWTLGAGAEGTISGNWSWKIEYLHVDLGKINTTFATFPGCYGGTVTNGGGGFAANCSLVVAGTGTISSRITDEIVRVGVNYRY